ncbi:8929_t:CDS:10 [Acaulospora morrowiae]|uniref:8929_t:CDS:1 n=1 Tax=Acaulospora morrowiae TaxID=94023 RepID=A0A9N9AQZ5_9GLOM|nr:8929_t:CDS:10 [Acaulospora morrowiae]
MYGTGTSTGGGLAVNAHQRFPDRILFVIFVGIRFLEKSKLTNMQTNRLNNLNIALLNKEIQPPNTNTNLFNRRKFYTYFYPNETIFNVNVPNSYFKRFTPDGNYMIGFSRDQNFVQLFYFEYTYLETSLDANALYEQRITSSQSETLCKEFCLITSNQKYMILASSSPSNCSVEEARLYPCSLNCIPNFDDITFYLVELATGKTCDTRTYKNECIHLLYHSGVSLMGNLFSIMSIQNQTIRILHIKDDGRFIDVQDVGWLSYDDDELVLARYRDFDLQYNAQRKIAISPTIHRNASSDFMELDDERYAFSSSFLSSNSLNDMTENKVPSPNTFSSPQQGIATGISVNAEAATPISGIKQRMLSYLFKKAYHSNDGGLALRHFYQIFAQLASLVMWKMQFIDESRFLIKFGSIDCVTGRHHESAAHTTFFVIYNFLTTEVSSVYDNASEEFLTEFENSPEIFQRVAFNQPSLCDSAYSNNIYAKAVLEKRLYAIRHARNGGPSQVVKRVLSSLPYSPQTCSESPYFDHSLFAYDDNIVSAFDRPRPCQENIAKFYSRKTGEFKFKLTFGLPNKTSIRTKRSVALIVHPNFPFIISVQYTVLQLPIINFHVRSSS